MTQPAKARRFRVALSFPGEHRSCVENIAEILATRLGREKILYDKWYQAEFARPNLDVYLPKLYHDDSDLVVVFLCGEYNAKEWCGLEWRACRDVLKHKEDDRLMFLRLDQADIAGLYSIDGYIDIREMSSDNVATHILNRLEMLSVPRDAKNSYRLFISKLPVVNPTLIGRDEQLGVLDRAWADPATNFVQIIAAGGTGKTALMDKWFRRQLGEAEIFGWSFYSQGTSEKSQPSSDPFFNEILAWLNIDIEPTASIYAKAEAVARRLREERVLLILDGVEPLQDSSGSLRDFALKALLQELATANKGLVLCTTRVRLDIPDDTPRVLSIDLDNLTPEHGAEYLHHLKVEGTDVELQEASWEYGNHALALTLLGTYLVDFCGADIRRRVEIRKLIVDDVKYGGHARRVMAAYERMFKDKPEADILHALGYFNRPAEPEALKLVLPATENLKYRASLKRLYDARLVLTADPANAIDCHPLIREHFAAVLRDTAAPAFRKGHSRLYKHYCGQAPHRPDTLQQMTPLFYAVYHACQAGRHTSAFQRVYYERICRRGDAYLNKTLGAQGADLSLLANFFQNPWTEPIPALSPRDRVYVIDCAAFALFASGRLEDALAPMTISWEGFDALKDWENAVNSRFQLSDLLLALGRVQEAITAARQSVHLADRSASDSRRVLGRAALGTALHQSGDLLEAERIFEEAENIQAKNEPINPLLYSLQGYQYCDLLLDQGSSAAVLERASAAMVIAEVNHWIHSIGLAHLLLGRAHAPGSAESTNHLNLAVDFLRRVGNAIRISLGLLARGTPHDLEEVFRIASRSGMRLSLADCHIASCRLALKNGDFTKAGEHFQMAEALVNETGYHRRDKELQQLRATLDAETHRRAGA